jgi:hypothetical protein
VEKQMTPERWQRVKDVLHGALELTPEQRPGFLDQPAPPIRRCARIWNRFWLPLMKPAPAFSPQSLGSNSCVLGPKDGDMIRESSFMFTEAAELGKGCCYP